MEMLKKFYHGKRILVTGNTGFKGSWLAYWLKTMGADVYGISLPPTASQKTLFESLNLSNSVLTYYQDIAVFEPVAKIIHTIKPEVIFHLAAQPLVKTSYSNPMDTYSSNIVGTLNILELIRQLSPSHAIKAAVIITTDKCYQDLARQTPYTEQDPLGGYDPYSASKACVELIVDSYRKSYFDTLGIGVATARGGNILGGGDFGEFRVVPDIIRTVAAKLPLYLRSPQAMRPWQYVLDALYGYLLLAKCLYESPLEFNEAFNFSNATVKQITVLNLVNRVLERIGAEDTPIHYQSEIFHETSYLQLDSQKARKRLNWVPQFGLDDMLLELGVWYSAYLKGKDLCVMSRKLLDNYIERITAEYA